MKISDELKQEIVATFKRDVNVQLDDSDFSNGTVEVSYLKNNKNVLYINLFDNFCRNYKNISTDKKHLLFDWNYIEKIDIICENFFYIRNNITYKIFDKDFNPLFNTTFDGITNYDEDCAIIRKDRKYNFINSSGELISNEWFIDWWAYDGLFIMVKNEENLENLFDASTGRLILNQWYDNINELCGGYLLVEKNNHYNIVGGIHVYGESKPYIVSKYWFDEEPREIGWDNFDEKLFLVKVSGKFNCIKEDGTFLSNMWFDACWNCCHQIYLRIDDVKYVITKDLKIKKVD